jgi:hypothetical protein
MALERMMRLRVTPGQLALWREAAEADGTKLSNWVRQVCMQAATQAPSRKRKARGSRVEEAIPEASGSPACEFCTNPVDVAGTWCKECREQYAARP